MVKQIPEEIWATEIWDYIHNNRDMISLMSVCKEFKNMGKKHGYVRHLNLSMDSDYMNLMFIWGKINLESLRSMIVAKLTTPAAWIPFKWPEQMIFSHCRMGDNKISPPKGTRTEVLRITDLSRSKLVIDWSRLPNLKVLELHVYDVNLEGLEGCRDLEKVCLDVKSDNKVLPSWLAGLEKLTKIVSNLTPENSLHFVSKLLTSCLVPKNMKHLRGRHLPAPCGCKNCQNRVSVLPHIPFTSDSTLVPKSHLTDNTYINCAVFQI